jgi:hypothetical protein
MTQKWEQLFCSLLTLPFDLKDERDNEVSPVWDAFRKKAGDEHTFPSPGESSAVAIFNPKTSALCYDRVWLPWVDGLSPYPRSLTFFGDRLGNHIFLILLSMLSSVEFPELVIEPEWTPQLRDLIRPIGEYLRKKGRYGDKLYHFTEPIPLRPELVREGIASMVREVARLNQEAHKISAVPIYPAVALRDLAYKPGDASIVISALRNLDIVDEHQLQWDQVVEFREDPKAKKAYRRLLHWLDKEMLGKSTAFVEDEISSRMEDYRASMRKHGISTVKGVLERAMSGETLAKAAAAAGGGAGLTGEAIWAAFAGAGYFVGDAIVSVLQAHLELQDELEKHRDISFVCEAQRRFGTKR